MEDIISTASDKESRFDHLFTPCYAEKKICLETKALEAHCLYQPVAWGCPWLTINGIVCFEESTWQKPSLHGLRSIDWTGGWGIFSFLLTGGQQIPWMNMNTSAPAQLNNHFHLLYWTPLVSIACVFLFHRAVGTIQHHNITAMYVRHCTILPFKYLEPNCCASPIPLM